MTPSHLGRLLYVVKCEHTGKSCCDYSFKCFPSIPNSVNGSRTSARSQKPLLIMNEVLLETESISYDVVGSYHDTTQNLSLPYRTGATNTEEPDLRPHPNASPQGDEVAETRWSRLPEVHPASISSDQKRVVKRHIKDGRSHKASKPKNRSPATTSQKLIRIARSQQNPWTMLSPNSAPTASVLPCSLPDTLVKQYLHQSQLTQVSLPFLKRICTQFADCKQFPIHLGRWCQEVHRVPSTASPLP